MTYTKQPCSFSVFTGPVKKAKTFPVQPIKTGDPETDEINDIIRSIYCSLSYLLTKLQELNSAIEHQIQE